MEENYLKTICGRKFDKKRKKKSSFKKKKAIKLNDYNATLRDLLEYAN